MNAQEVTRRISFIADSQGFGRVAAEFQRLEDTQRQFASTSTQTSASIASTVRQFEALERRLSPLAKAQQQFAKDSRIIENVLNDGKISVERAAAAHDMLKSRLAAVEQQTRAHTTAAERNSNVVALNRGQLTNLSYQLNDIATGLVSGQSPFMIMAQQGGQVVQILQQGPQGVGGSIKALASSIAGLATPARLAMGAIAGVAAVGYAAWSAWDDKVKAMQVSLNGLGRITGLTTGAMMQLAERSASTTGGSISTAAGGITKFVGAGIGGGNALDLTNSAQRFGRAFGLSTNDAQDELAKAFGNPAAGLAELTKRFGPFGYEVEQNVKRLTAANRLEEARAALFRAFEERLKGAADASTVLTRAMDSAKGVFADLGKKIADAVSAPTLEQRLSTAREKLAEANRPRDFFTLSRPDSGPIMPWQRGLNAAGRAQQEIDFLQEQIAASFAGPAIEQAKAAAAAQSYLAAEIKKARDAADLGAQAIIARTASERLAADIAKINREAIDDANKAKLRETEIYRAQVTAIAEATRAMDDFRRKIADESALAGGLSAAERVRRQVDIELRDIRERTDLPRMRPGDDQWRSQVKFGERAGDLWTGWAGSLPEGYGRGISRFTLPDMNTIPLNASTPFRGAQQGAPAAQPAQPAAAAFAQDLDRLREKLLAIRLGELWIPMLNDAERAIAGNSRMLDVQIATFGRSTAEVARATEAQRLENEIKRQGLEISDKMTKRIAQLAEAQAEYAARAEKAQESQRRVVESMDALRSTTSDVFASPLKALAHGEKPGEALRQAGVRGLDRIIENSVGRITGGLFGDMGKPGGGLFGNMLGGLLGASGLQNTAMMTVNAGMVTVNGGIPGVGGSAGGGLFDSIAKLFTPSAFGNAFDRGNVVPFAAGGIVTRPTVFPMARGGVGLMGEAGPEGILPLRRNNRGELGVMAGVRGGGGDGGVTIINQNYSSAKVETQKERGPDGRTVIRQIIRDEVSSAIANGDTDAALRGRAGIMPRKVING